LTDRRYDLWLNLLSGVGCMKFNALINAFGDARSVFNASGESLREVGIGEKAAHTILHNRDLTRAENLLNKLTELGVKFYTQFC
jgi:predicted Rossmann fold nucleotide-binding protein DprA/Smf involved in DNA uptake